MSQALHGTPASGPSLGAFGQFRALAKMRAVEVFPTPRAPVKRYAWATRPEAMALVRARATWPCPITSANVCGRYRRASTV